MSFFSSSINASYFFLTFHFNLVVEQGEGVQDEEVLIEKFGEMLQWFGPSIVADNFVLYDRVSFFKLSGKGNPIYLFFVDSNFVVSDMVSRRY